MHPDPKEDRVEGGVSNADNRIPSRLLNIFSQQEKVGPLEYGRSYGLCCALIWPIIELKESIMEALVSNRVIDIAVYAA